MCGPIRNRLKDAVLQEDMDSGFPSLLFRTSVASLAGGWCSMACRRRLLVPPTADGEIQGLRSFISSWLVSWLVGLFLSRRIIFVRAFRLLYSGIVNPRLDLHPKPLPQSRYGLTILLAHCQNFHLCTSSFCARLSSKLAPPAHACNICLSCLLDGLCRLYSWSPIV